MTIIHALVNICAPAVIYANGEINKMDIAEIERVMSEYKIPEDALVIRAKVGFDRDESGGCICLENITVIKKGHEPRGGKRRQKPPRELVLDFRAGKS